MFFQSLIFFDGDIFSFELVLLSKWNCFSQLIHSLQGTQQQYSDEATKLVHLSPRYTPMYIFERATQMFKFFLISPSTFQICRPDYITAKKG